MRKNIDETPNAKVDLDDSSKPLKSGLVLKLLVGIFTILSIAISFTSQFIQSGAFSGAIGGGLAPIVIGGLVVLLFQIGKGFQNTRSKYKIFLWCQILFLLSGINQILLFATKNT